MSTFLFRCPVTGYRVQGFVADSAMGDDTDTFQSFVCPACTRTHLVNPKTGKTIGADAKPA